MTSDTPDTDLNVTAFFNTREEAEQAIAHLTQTGLARDRILLRIGAARKAASADDGKGLLQEVKELILPSEEPDSAVAAVKHEGFLLSVRPDPDTHDSVVKLLDQDGGLGIESREDIWPDWKSCTEKPPSDDLIDADPDREPAPEQDGEDETTTLSGDPVHETESKNGAADPAEAAGTATVEASVRGEDRVPGA